MTAAETDFLRLILDPGVEIPRLTGLTDEEVRQGLFFSIRKLIHQVGRNPFVIILDDLHWADPESLELLKYLLEDLESHRLLFVLVHRDELTPTWDKRLNYNEIALEPFPQDEVETFIRVILGADRVAQKVRDKLSELSLGNPLFIEELVRQMIDRETLEIETDDEGKKLVRLKGESELEIPSTLHALIASRFDGLEKEPKEVLRWAMLLGTRFQADELEKLLTSLDVKNIESHMATLFDHGYLAEQSVFPKRVHRFTHDLIFETVKNSLSEDETQKRHDVIGDFLSFEFRNNKREAVDRIAEHFLRGDDDIKAIDACLEAGRMMSQSHQFRRALHFHREAARRWENLPMVTPPSHEVLAPLVDLLLTVGELGESETALNQWKYRGITKFPHAEGVFHQLLTGLERKRANYEEALEASDKALEAFGSDPRWEDERYEMSFDRIMSLVNMGNRKQAIHEAYKVLRELNDHRHTLTRMRIWSTIATNSVIAGDLDLGFEFLEKARGLLTPDMPVNLQIEMWARTAYLYDHSGQFKEAMKAYGHAIEMARDAGLRHELAKSLTNQGIAAEEDGNYILALENFNQAILEAREIMDKPNEIRSTLGIIDSLADLGVIEESKRKWQELQSKFELVKDVYLLGVNQSVFSTLSELGGNLEDSLQATQSAHDLYSQGALAHSATRVQLRYIRRSAQAQKDDLATLLEDFEELALRYREQQWPAWRYQLKSTAFILATLGAEKISQLEPDIDPQQCPATWIRQELYVAKIRWLDSRGKDKEAKDLRQAYRQERDRIAEKVPPEYREAFYNHPLYKVP